MWRAQGQRERDTAACVAAYRLPEKEQRGAACAKLFETLQHTGNKKRLKDVIMKEECLCFVCAALLLILCTLRGTGSEATAGYCG